MPLKKADEAANAQTIADQKLILVSNFNSASNNPRIGARKISLSMSTPARWCLQCYSVCLGCSLSFSSFVWMSLVLFALSRTDPRSDELMTERYLECSLGLLGFTSSLALVYGAFVESRTWLSVWTIGSATVLASCFTPMKLKLFLGDSSRNKHEKNLEY